MFTLIFGMQMECLHLYLECKWNVYIYIWNANGMFTFIFGMQMNKECKLKVENCVKIFYASGLPQGGRRK